MRISSKKSGFTLIELLVVISILGVMSAILLVSMNGLRAKSRDAKRIADLAQISKALELYYADNGTYPQQDGDSAEYNWYDMINELRDHGLISDSSGSGGSWAGAMLGIPVARASAPSPGIQDPLYDSSSGIHTYGYMTFSSPAYGGYILRTRLENISHPLLANSYEGSFIYNGTTTGWDACDKSEGFYCLISGGNGNSYTSWH